VKQVRIVISEIAAADIIEQSEWYEAQSGAKLAKRWEKASTTSVLRIAKSPESGTPCHFQSSELADVRRTAIGGFPKHLIFYRVSEQAVCILRVVHGARDLEKLL